MNEWESNPWYFKCKVNEVKCAKLLVKGKDTCFRGCEFESWYWILDGNALKQTKRVWGWPIFIKES